MNYLHSPRFDSGFGSMFIVESCGEYAIIDTYTSGQSNPRKYVKNLLDGEKAKLIFTHAHRDHNGDADYYIDNNMVSDFYVSRVVPNQESHKDKDRQNALISKCKKKGIPVHYVSTGDKIKCGTAVINILYTHSKGGNNAKSICMRIDMGGCRILYLGDAETSTLDGLNKAVSSKDLANIDLMTFNHHGVTSNNPQSWVNKIKPTFGISNCCGENKSTYRSWASTAYSRWEKAEVNMYSTQYNGNLVFRCTKGVITPYAERNTTVKYMNGRRITVNKSAKFFYRGNLLKADKSDKLIACEVMLDLFGKREERAKKLGNKNTAVQDIVNIFAEDREALIHGLAEYVLCNWAGTSEDRKKLLGDYYADVQKIVTESYTVANNIIHNVKDYGKGEERVKNLTEAGYDAEVVQAYIDYLLL